MCTLVHMLTSMFRMSDSEHEADLKNPYVVFENPGDIGYNQAFVSNDLVWDGTMTATQASDEKVMELCVSLVRSHTDGESLAIRQDWLLKAFTAQYNRRALYYYANFFDVELPANAARKDIIKALIEMNIPFIPWDVFHAMKDEARARLDALDEGELAGVDLSHLYEAFQLAHPFGGSGGPKRRGDATSTASSAANAKATSRKYADALKGVSSRGPPGLTSDQRAMFDEDKEADFSARASEQRLKTKAMAALQRKKAIELADAAYARQIADDDDIPVTYNKRQRTTGFDDEEPQPISGLLALDKFLKSMRMSIENSLYIDFASMSKDRLDQLQVLGVASASSKRLSSSTVLVTSATGADIQTLTYDFEAISSGFLYSYINLLSESSFPDAMARVKDRLAWWQWLTDFFGQNKPAIVKFIHAFMLKHHKAPFWVPVTEERCSMLAIQARDTCPMPLAPPTFHSGPTGSSRDKSSRGKSKTPTKVYPGPGTLTVNGGVTFTASQTAKLVQWRSRFAGFCQSRMTKDYTCSREKRGKPCKYKHECVWCHSASCTATCAQAEKF